MNRKLSHQLEIFEAIEDSTMKIVHADMCTAHAAQNCFDKLFSEQSINDLEHTADTVRVALEPLLGYTPSVEELCIESLRTERDKRIRNWPDGTYYRLVHPLADRMQASRVIANYTTRTS